jgi:hypothetical protein
LRPALGPASWRLGTPQRTSSQVHRVKSSSQLSKGLGILPAESQQGISCSRAHQGQWVGHPQVADEPANFSLATSTKL